MTYLYETAEWREWAARQERYTDTAAGVEFALTLPDSDLRPFLEALWDGRSAVDAEWADWRVWVDARRSAPIFADDDLQ